METEAIFNVGQKAFIEKDGKVLVVWNKYGLDFPGGRINSDEINDEKYENLVKSLKREVLEETGMEINVGDPFATWYYNRKKAVFLVGYRCNWVDGEVKLSDEHFKYDWVGKDDYEKYDDGGEYFNALKKYFTTNGNKRN